MSSSHVFLIPLLAFLLSLDALLSVCRSVFIHLSFVCCTVCTAQTRIMHARLAAGCVIGGVTEETLRCRSGGAVWPVARLWLNRKAF